MMIRSINHLQTPLESIKENPKDIKENAKLVELIPEPEDFEILKKVAPILSKFESISQSLSADQTPTICYVVPKLHFITRFLTSMINKKDQDEFITQLSQVKKLMEVLRGQGRGRLEKVTSQLTMSMNYSFRIDFNNYKQISIRYYFY